MKFILVCLLLVSSSVFAANCNELFRESAGYYKLGVTEAKGAQYHLELAADESNRPNPSMTVVCRKLKMAKKAFNADIGYYNDCYWTFSAAANVCTGQNSNTARNNQTICSEEEGRETGNRDKVIDYLAQLCR